MVLAFELLNEVMDAVHWGHGSLHLDADGAVKDILNTMLWPTVVVAAAKVFSRPGGATEVGPAGGERRR